VEHPYKTELISTQRWRCLKKAGFPADKPEIHIQIPDAAKRSIRAKVGGEGGWIHVSPFTTENYKELPSDHLSELLRQMHRRFPDKQIILTCAANDREKAKMAALQASLDFQPWRIFAGDLDLLELAALVQASSIHMGGDSGGLHVAWMTRTPTVTWFRHYDGLADWRPVGDRHRSVTGERTPEGLAGIETSRVVAAAAELLKSQSH
jgi:ADP-heptose:LPS heptosyltransferase